MAERGGLLGRNWVPAKSQKFATVAVVSLAVASVIATAGFGGVAQAAPAQAPAVVASHAYRHGAVPTFTSLGLKAASVTALPRSKKNVTYSGGVDGVGVTTGHPEVYLVFWGSQWGTESTAGKYDTFSGDPSAIAPDLQAFFSGLGTDGDKWSGTATQYCQGVAAGTMTCPAGNTSHVGYPTGGALAGVWEDTSSAAPKKATAHQLALEAVAAATHFGNSTQASNRNTQYFIVSPTGTEPDGFNTPSGGFCAWHDYSSDPTLDGGGGVTSPIGTVAFTNMPYVENAGASCGANFVNPGATGANDGVTIVAGHEYTETITDQFPTGGWIDAAGEEVADLCAWKSSGTGKAKDLKLATGSFAVQGIWSNAANKGKGGCSTSSAIITDPAVSKR